nr:hypothetical protein [Tanacetum cinerariifolium]
VENQSQNGSDGKNGNGRNRNGGNRNYVDGNGGNGNGNPNENNRGARPVARECTYQDLMKCQPLNFKGTKGVVGLTRWFEKMKTVFHISNCPEKYQVKYYTSLEYFNYRLHMTGSLLIQKIESELCTKMVLEEEDRVEKFIEGWIDVSTILLDRL